MKHRVTLPGLQGGAAAEGGGWWHETSNFRKFVPQMLVTIINNLLLMDLSMMLAFPTLVVGALYLSEEPDQDGLRLDQEQASWLGSLVYLCQPLGSLVSGVVTEPLGRRRGMMFVNVPPLIGWLMLRFARSVPALFAANAVLGLSIGFMEAPVLCYVGEISEPRVRSLLTATTGVMAQTGYLLVYLLGATLPWRTAATVCATIPVISFLAMLLVPESPLWLLARGRDAEAQRALCWLRGWVRPEAVADELRDLKAYAEHTKRLMDAYALPQLPEGEQASLASRGLRDVTQKLRVLGLRVRDLFRAQTRRPLLLVIGFFFVFHSSGMSGVRPYMVHIIEEYGLPVDPLWATVMTAILGLAATGFLMAVVARVGKRRLSLVSIAGCAISCIVLGGYAFAVVSGSSAVHVPAPSTLATPANYTSTSASTSAPDAAPVPAPATWIPLTAFIALSFFTYFGVGQIPWMYVAEVYPLRSRGLASGVTAAVAYVIYFTAAKTYLQLETALSLHGVFWLYAAFGVAGFVFLYLQLPETEGKTLEEVEDHFAAKGRRREGKANPKGVGKGKETEKDLENTGSSGGDASFLPPNSPPCYDNPLHVTHM